MSANFEPRPEDQSEKSDENYSFLQETIKEDQMNSRKFLRGGFRVVCYGVLFGAAFWLGIHAISPITDDFRNSSSGINFVKEEEKEESVSDESVKEEAEKKEEAEEEELELNSDNYSELYQKIKDVRKETEASIATVRGYLDKDDKSASVEVYGCVLTKNNSRLLLMTYSNSLQAMKKIEVEFFGGQKVPASIRGKYDTLHMAVLEVEAGALSKTSNRLVKPAALGTSAGIKSGDPVLVLGNIYGFPDSAGYGMIQDVSGVIQEEDGLYYRMKTDIQGTKDGTGIMINLQGDVIGIVSPVAADEDGKVSGIGISSLKSVLGFLLDGKDVPYTGVTGTEVTEEVLEEQELPAGVYVQRVSADSPAMIAGIKNGDIITAVNGEEVNTMEEYHKMLMRSTPNSAISVQGKRRGNEGYVDMDFIIDLY